MENTELPKKLEKEMPKQRIAVTTSTLFQSWYPEECKNPKSDIDKVRGDLALEMLKTASDKGFQIIVVDGGSSNEFLDTLRAIKIDPIQAIDKRISPSRQQAFLEASKLSDVEVICWTEPEKISIPADCLQIGTLPIIQGGVDITVPGRTENSFSTYPPLQAKSEKTANEVFHKMLISFQKKYPYLFGDIPIPKLDMYFGPKFFRNTPELLRIFTTQYEIGNLKDPEKKMDPQLYGNSTIFPIITALSLGYRVISVDVPYIHPQIQTKTEIGNPQTEKKRQNQFNGILRSCAELCRYLAGAESRVSALLSGS